MEPVRLRGVDFGIFGTLKKLVSRCGFCNNITFKNMVYLTKSGLRMHLSRVKIIFLFTGTMEIIKTRDRKLGLDAVEKSVRAEAMFLYNTIVYQSQVIASFVKFMQKSIFSKEFIKVHNIFPPRCFDFRHGFFQKWSDKEQAVTSTTIQKYNQYT